MATASVARGVGAAITSAPPAPSETKNAHSCETPRRRGFCRAMNCSAAAVASATRSDAAVFASAARSEAVALAPATRSEAVALASATRSEAVAFASATRSEAAAVASATRSEARARMSWRSAIPREPNEPGRRPVAFRHTCAC